MLKQIKRLLKTQGIERTNATMTANISLNNVYGGMLSAMGNKG
jgi:hypothetical protein